jgi:hypothetical protein
MNRLFAVLAALIVAPCLWAAEPIELDKDTYKSGGAVITLGINWGRTWKCGTYQNAQIQELTFRRAPLNTDSAVSLELKTPSKLAVDNKFITYAYVVEPGEYILTGFDVKVARSVKEVGHLKGTEADLLKDGKPTGGSFTVKPGEVVYIGHFGLDCGAEPFLWRYYLESQKEFEGWVAEFRTKYPFANDLAAQFRLFETTSLGNPFSLPTQRSSEPQQRAPVGRPSPCGLGVPSFATLTRLR